MQLISAITDKFASNLQTTGSIFNVIGTKCYFLFHKHQMHPKKLDAFAKESHND